MTLKPGPVCAALLWAVWLCAGSAEGAERAQQATMSAQAGGIQSLVVPGGTAELARVAGIDPAIPRARVMLAVIRVLHGLPEGADSAADARRRRVAEYLKQLTASPKRPGSPADDLVPLPLPAAAWSRVPGAGRDRKATLLELILGNRNAALAYYGLCAMDDETRAFLAASPAALDAVFDPRRAAVLAMYGRSLHVRGAGIDVPGGLPAVAIWEDLIDVRVTNPAAFIARVLDMDQGRLALLYDVVAHLDTPAQSFALGLAEPDPARRAERFGALYLAAAPALVAWNPRARPFERVLFDVAHVLSELVMLPDGRPAGPW